MFDPQHILGTEQGMWWNPLRAVATITDARRLAEHFAAAEREPGVSRDASSEELVANLLLAAAVSGRDILAAYRWAVSPRDDEPARGPPLAVATSGRRDPADTWPLVEVVVTGRVDWAARTFTTAAGPRGEMARLNANLAALRTLRTLEAEDRPATAEEQTVLARWSGWGAVPGVFEGRVDHRDHARFAAARDQLRQVLDEREYAAAERNTLNAHYTDAAYVQAIWDAVTGLGFQGGDVLEPGCGPGTFIGLAPDGARLTGVEVEPVTAGIAAALYPHATIRTESFADTRAPAGAFDLTIGNVPFGKFVLADRRHNPGKHSIHNHFLIKSLHLTRPGAARQAVHDTIRATPALATGTGTTGADADRPGPDPAAPPRVVLTDDEIRTLVPKLAAALTRDERIWLNQATARLCAQPDLRAVAQTDDPDRFAQVFSPAITAQLADAPARLAELAAAGDGLVNELRTLIQHYVYTKTRTETESPAKPAPADDAAKAAAVAALAFRSTTAPAATSASASTPAARGTGPAARESELTR
ncbi:hypothetical protein [Verrucosispora sp. NA02020]|uniref:hypothetical protein n=1 Tax=Verrucosispora sp. NA02020 TaxID=2742132 RepID=UPI001C37D100|nr:hypothetical protein [Verrucosispora sp. NA02020]